MRLSRLMLSVPTALFVLVSLTVVVFTGCTQKPRAFPPGIARKTYECGGSNPIVVKVDPGSTHGVDKLAIYICGGDTVVWQPNAGVTSFAVQFNGASGCPFTSGCSTPITTNSPQTVINPLPNVLTVYTYSLSINANAVSDPHVVGGGGY